MEIRKNDEYPIGVPAVGAPDFSTLSTPADRYDPQMPQGCETDGSVHEDVDSTSMIYNAPDPESVANTPAIGELQESAPDASEKTAVTQEVPQPETVSHEASEITPPAAMLEPTTETDKAVEVPKHESLVRVKGIGLAVEGDKDLSSRPIPTTVQDAAREGKTLKIVVENDGSGPQMYASPELNAGSLIAEEVPATPGEAGIKGDLSTTLTHWGGLVSVKPFADAPQGGPQPKETPALPPDPENGITHLDKLFTPGTYQVEIKARGVAGDELKEVSGDLADMRSDAETIPSAQRLTAELGTVLETLDEGQASGVFELGVSVGAQSPDELEAALQRTIAALPSTGRTWVRVPTAPDKASVEAAIQADGRGFEVAGPVADMIRFPEISLPGYTVRTVDRTLSVNYELAKGEVPIRYATIIDPRAAGQETGGEIGPMVTSGRELIEHAGFVGATGSGKSVALEELAVATWKATEGQTPIVFIDPQTEGFGQKLLGRLKGEGFNPNGRIITPGNSEFNAVMDVLDPNLSSARGVINTMVTGIMIVLGNLDPASARPLERYVKQGVRKSFTDNGFNLKLNKSDYPGGYPAHPTHDQIMADVRSALKQETTYGAKAAEELGEFASGQYGSETVDSPVGAFIDARQGQSIETPQLLLPGSFSELNFSHMNNEKATTLASYVTFVQLINAIKAQPEHAIPNGGPRLMLMIDECRLFPNTPAGAYNAGLLRWLRHQKVSVVWATQNGVYDYHPDAISNTNTLSVGRTPDPKDQEMMASKKGRSSLPVVANLRRGQAVVLGQGSDDPVLVRYDNPHVQVRLPATFTDGRDVLDTTKYGQLVRPETLIRAQDVDSRLPLAAHIEGVTELNALLAARGWFNAEKGYALPVRLGPGIQDKIRSMSPEVADVVAVATTNYVHSSVEGRHVFRYAPGGAEAATAYVKERMEAELEGRPQPVAAELPANIIPETEKFGPAKRILKKAMLAPRHPESATWESELEVPQLLGATAVEQLTSTKMLEPLISDVLTSYMKALAEREAGQPSEVRVRPLGVIKDGDVTFLNAQPPEPSRPTAQTKIARLVDAARLQTRKLTGGAPDSTVEIALYHKVAAALAKDKLEMPYWPTVPGAANVVGLPGIKKALEKYIEDRKESAPRPAELAAVEAALNVRIIGATASQAYAAVLAQETAVKEQHQLRMAGPQAKPLDNLLARDPRGGTILNNVIVSLIAQDDPSGEIITELRAALKEGRPMAEGLAQRIASEGDDYRLSEKWITTLRQRFINNPNIVMEDVDRVEILDIIREYMLTIRNEAARIKATPLRGAQQQTQKEG